MTGLDEGPVADPTHAIAELSRIVLADETVETVLQRIAELAKRTVPGAVEVSVTLVRGETPVTAAFTGHLALEADEMQYERGFGPCLDAARGGVLIRIDDMPNDPRWPDYAAKVSAIGVGSSMSIPLPLQEDVIGALNVYGDRPHAFDDPAVGIAETFGAHAAVALANADMYASTAQLAQQMKDAMTSRAVIEQAKGIIMARRGCTADDAFQELVRASQAANRKLRDLASDVVASVVTDRSPRTGRPTLGRQPGGR
jgi:GAF domain-containing protein